MGEGAGGCGSCKRGREGVGEAGVQEGQRSVGMRWEIMVGVRGK